MGMLPLMTIDDLFDLVLAYIMAEHGRILLNMGMDLPWFVNFFVVSHFERVWKEFYLCFWSPMAPQKGSVGTSTSRKMRADLTTEEATTHYQDSVSPAAKETVLALEEEVRLSEAYQDDNDVDEKVGEIIPDLDCSRNRDTKFHGIMELYWKAKTMVARGMFPKEQDHRKFI
jgi:hypothetical protein